MNKAQEEAIYKAFKDYRANGGPLTLAKYLDYVVNGRGMLWPEHKYMDSTRPATTSLTDRIKDHMKNLDR
jgi:hypothetical protein